MPINSLLMHNSFTSMQSLQNYRFKFEDDHAWRNHLSEEGYVVISNYIPEDDCLKYIQQFWDILEVLSDGRLDRNKLETQSIDENYPPVLLGGMLHYVGHSRPQWELRKRLAPLFQRLWRTQNLKSSFDGFCFMNGLRNYKETPINASLHTDQSPTRDYIWSYQGILSLTTSGDNQGGFVVVPKSHLYHRKYFQEKSMLDFKKDWYLVPQQDKSISPLSNCHKLNVQAGDFIVFDSRTFHSNTVPRQKVIRVCTYICMLPEEHLSQDTKEKRKIAVTNRLVSSHHPGNGFRIFPSIPQSAIDKVRFGQLLQKVNNCVFDEEIQSLI